MSKETIGVMLWLVILAVAFILSDAIQVNTDRLDTHIAESSAASEPTDTPLPDPRATRDSVPDITSEED